MEWARIVRYACRAALLAGFVILGWMFFGASSAQAADLSPLDGVTSTVAKAAAPVTTSVAQAVAPTTSPVVKPATTATTNVAKGIVAPVQKATAPTVSAVAAATKPVTRPVTSTVGGALRETGATAAVASAVPVVRDVLQPVATPVRAVVDPVTTPVREVVDPVVGSVGRPGADAPGLVRGATTDTATSSAVAATTGEPMTAATAAAVPERAPYQGTAAPVLAGSTSALLARLLGADVQPAAWSFGSLERPDVPSAPAGPTSPFGLAVAATGALGASSTVGGSLAALLGLALLFVLSSARNPLPASWALPRSVGARPCFSPD